MSDDSLTLSERAAKNALFTIIGHGAASLSLIAIIWLATSVTAMDKQLAKLRAEVSVGILPRVIANEHDIELLQNELQARTRDRFTTTDGASLEFRLLREISNLQTEVRRLVEKWDEKQ